MKRQCKNPAITSDVAGLVSEKTGYPKKKLQGIINATFEAMAELLGERRCININSFGSFRLKQVPRKVYDFKTNSICEREVRKFVLYPYPKFKNRAFEHFNPDKSEEK